jgi:hypothetical protein
MDLEVDRMLLDQSRLKIEQSRKDAEEMKCFVANSIRTITRSLDRLRRFQSELNCSPE